MQTTTELRAEQIQQKMGELAERFRQDLVVHPDGATIEDYPIGGSHRGKCKLEVEYKKGDNTQWRTVRTTTDKHGRWCNPKKSTYSPGSGFVVSGPKIVERDLAWLSLSHSGIWLHAANGDFSGLLKSPFSSAPRLRTERWRIGNDVRTFEADPPEILEAWRVWCCCLQDMDRLLNDLGKLDAAVREVVEGSAA